MEINNEFVVEHLLDLALEFTWHNEDISECVKSAVEVYNEELCEDEPLEIDFTEELTAVAERNDIAGQVEQQLNENCSERWQNEMDYYNAVCI